MISDNAKTAAVASFALSILSPNNLPKPASEKIKTTIGNTKATITFIMIDGPFTSPIFW